MMTELTERPGYKLFIQGATRGEMRDANVKAGFPCYCDSLWVGYCDLCTGLAEKGSERWKLAMKEAFDGIAIDDSGHITLPGLFPFALVVGVVWFFAHLAQTGLLNFVVGR